MKERVAVILGPTATGKSHCAIELAKRLNGEIISGDSMYVYRGMDIGTAKPTEAELNAVPHHLVDILPADAEFNVVDFKERAEELIKDINARGKLPIIAGGTGLYIKALLEGYAFNSVDADEAMRQELEQFTLEHGKEALHARLEQLDPEAAARLHVNDTRRVIRAIEAASKGEEINQYGAEEMPFEAVVFGLNMPREILYERINRRVDIMIEQGLEKEVRRLLEEGVPVDCQSMKSIGYRQMLWYINDGMDYDFAVDKLKQATRNFAKRQVTFYKRMPYIQWYELDAEPNYENVVNSMEQTLVEKFKLV
ncbi:MAG: tRNA (adenosine(37)-N6)-dimethylallyltransferase MiaA [Phascolarctobacterium sp.]|nr:tRNA (adenosine(37)-N6)-dimethylallyltransferase MiaA [Phascolarctobacterium sp.]MBQ7760303.1 tRNA (adenosine(37)-N6)-dimethylallyltransferase MiaA [Acidaminococcaceae bacterium]